MTAPKYVEIVLDSGIRAWVTPLSRYQLKALDDAAKAKYPYPDKADYTVAMPEDVGIEGGVIPAEDNPEYQQLVEEADRARSHFITEAMFDICVHFPDFPDRAALIEFFADYIATQRRFMLLPDEAWEATWRFAVLRSASDEEQILAVVRDLLPVREAEITEEMRLFRPSVSWHAVKRVAKTRQTASGT